MQSKKGIEIERILPGSQAEQLGLLPGDILVSVNSHKLRDTIDFMFYGSDDSIEIEVKRNGNNFSLRAVREEGRKFGVDFKPFTIKTCRNNCIFCFIKQLPKGLRKTLYMKDDDYRMSFLYGNYISLSNLGKEDRRRIVEQRLSPLYISVHSTNRTLRNKLLCNAKGPDILKELKFFADNKIRLHTQIVLCPGYNDGKELSKTIRDLYGFYPYVSSIAVVPVGLTTYRKLTIKPVDKREARDALKVIESFQKRFKKKHGDPIVYGADELHIKAESPLPPLKDYKDFPQIENGIGLVPQFMNRIKKFIIPKSLPRNKKFLTFTGLSFYPFLKKFIKLLEIEGIQIELIPVENRFFGPSVTVTGLLTGRDVIRTLLDKITTQEMILVPDIVLKDREDMFLDNTSLRDMGEALNISVKKIDSTPEGLVHGISGGE